MELFGAGVFRVEIGEGKFAGFQGECVSVLPQRQLRVRMPELVRHEPNASTGFECQGGIGVAAVVGP